MQMEEKGLTSLLPFLIQHILRLVHNECLTHDKRGKKAGMPSGNLQIRETEASSETQIQSCPFYINSNEAKAHYDAYSQTCGLTLCDRQAT